MHLLLMVFISYIFYYLETSRRSQRSLWLFAAIAFQGLAFTARVTKAPITVAASTRQACPQALRVGIHARISLSYHPHVLTLCITTTELEAYIAIHYLLTNNKISRCIYNIREAMSMTTIRMIGIPLVFPIFIFSLYSTQFLPLSTTNRNKCYCV